MWGFFLVIVESLIAIYFLGVDYSGNLKGSHIKMKNKTTILAVVMDVFSQSLSSIVSIIIATVHCCKMIRVYSMLRTFDSILQCKSIESSAKLKTYLSFSFLSLLIISHVIKSYDEQVNVSTVRKTRSLMDGYWLLCEAVQVTTVFYRYQLLVMTFNLLANETARLVGRLLNYNLHPGVRKQKRLMVHSTKGSTQIAKDPSRSFPPNSEL
ncbi:hypothetical protein J6590_008659 [Homalodisca vitripennis]|nr:hypothetical protein J6590_008659 [Homalodisca vitripennis]